MSGNPASENPRCPRCGAHLTPEGVCWRCAGWIGFGPEPEVPSDFPPSLGQTRRFGDYELRAEIARGGMGVVYRARQLSLNREVAVKLMLHGALASAEDVERFRAEARAAAALNHPGIIAIHEVGECDGQHYFSMDLVPGQNLGEMTRSGPLPARRAATLIAEVARAVEYAHRMGVVHRDIKPTNVIVDPEGRTHVTDFGLARRVHFDATITQPGQVLGTPGFMAPELAAGTGHSAGPGVDIYALGALLYHLVTARPPFVGPSLADVLRQVAVADPVAPRLLNPQVPRDLETISLKCLAKEPGARYLTAAEFADDLERFLGDAPIRARPVGWAGRARRWARRNQAVAVLATAVAVLLAAAAIGSTYMAAHVERARRQEAALRQESELRLRQGERLIEFMVGDLVDRLQPVGRLDLLDSTIDEVNRFFSAVVRERMSPEEERIRAKTLRESGNIRFSQGRVAEALADYRQSIAAYRSLLVRFPDNRQWQFELAMVLNNLAVAQGRQNKFTQCIPIIEESLRIFQLLVGQEPRNALWLTWLGGIAHNFALGYVIFGNDGDAARIEELLRIAEDAERRAIALDPAAAKPKEHLALVLGTRGEFLKQAGKTDEAMYAYQEKLNLLGDLAAKEPKNQSYRYAYAMALSPPARVNIERGRFREARETLGRVASIIDQMIAEDPVNRDWQVYRINVLVNLGIAFRGEGNAGEALANFQKVWELSAAQPPMPPVGPRWGWAADCRYAMESAVAILTELADQDRRAGRIEMAAAEEKAAADWQARANTLPAIAEHPETGRPETLHSRTF